MGMEIIIVRDSLEQTLLTHLAEATFIDMVKAVVDVERRIMAVGGELHSDAEALLLADGSKQKDLWGINIYPDREHEDWLEYRSLINVRPSQGSRSMVIEDEELKEQIFGIVTHLTQPHAA